MTDTILPHELPEALERCPGASILSLDCFDTLLWRDCHAPSDLFAALPDVTPGQRIVGEAHARKRQATLRSRNEVTIGQIYQQVLPNSDAAGRERAVAAELEAESLACFAFEPTVELMRRAKAKGMTVIIVSDTYLDESQLLGLIEAAAGEEVAGLIDRVFASSTAGVSKAQGLLAHVLMAMKCKPGAVLHIGDNKAADFDGARALGIPALHLAQFGEAAKQRLRFERVCQQLTGDARGEPRGLQPHRALLSRGEPGETDPAKRLGFSVLGPVFHGYDRWLRAEAEALEAECGGKVHWLFMLRDGHLPHVVHNLGEANEYAYPVEISRFTATAASLTSPQAIEEHIALEHGLNPPTLARQLLFTEDEIQRVCAGDDKVEASRRLLAEMRGGQRTKLIRRRARGFAERLIAHVREVADPQPGDTLMLVDLGYNGSAQNRVDALLREAFDVHVAGRYLLLREMTATGLDKKGLIDARHFDPELLEAMCGNVAVLEQLATVAMGSVVDYTEDGKSIRKESAVKGRQSEVRDRMQAGCLDFCKQALNPPVIRTVAGEEERGWRDAAASVLMRFMFLPQPQELEVVKHFEHDVNLGSERMVALFDQDHAQEGMRRRGLFYMKGTSRMYLPAELAEEDMAIRLSLLVQKRFGLGLSYVDHAQRNIELSALYLGAEEGARASIAAVPTHDGYFAARLPLSDATSAVAVLIGEACEWFELGSITHAPIGSLSGGDANDQAPERLEGIFDGLTGHAPTIFQCDSSEGLILVNAPLAAATEPRMIEIVFRPLRLRTGVSSSAASPPQTARPTVRAQENAA